MNTPMKAGGTAIAVVALGLALAGCGSDTKSAPSVVGVEQQLSRAASRAAPRRPRRQRQPAGKNETIADYIKQNGITETPVKRGDPGSPTIDLPVPAGWADAGRQDTRSTPGAQSSPRDPGDGRPIRRRSSR